MAKVMGLHVATPTLNGASRLFLDMIDASKSFGNKVTIWDRPPFKKNSAVMPTRVGGVAQNVVLTMQTAASGAIPLKRLREYFPVTHIEKSDFRYAMIPSARVGYTYPPFPKVIGESIEGADSVFMDGEMMRDLPALFPALAEKGAFYIHYPTGNPPLLSPPWKKYLCNSRFTQKACKEIWGIGNAQVLYPPISTRFYHYSKPMDRRRFDVVLYSRLARDKFSKIQELTQRFPGIKVAVIGATYGYDPPTNRITLFRDATLRQVASVLADSRVYIHMKGIGGTPEEHFGQTPCEAIASGCLALVPDVGGIVEIPTVEKFDHGNLDDLFRQLDYFLGSPGMLEQTREKRAASMAVFDPVVREQELRSAFA